MTTASTDPTLDAPANFEAIAQPSKTEPFHELSVKNGHAHLLYTGEIEARKGIAAWARALGWIVREELVIPGWGRIDIVLRDSEESWPFLIELKLSLCKPAEIRKAFQQADGYGRWWSQQGEPNTVIVVGLTIDEAAVGLVQDAYPAIAGVSAARLLHGLPELGTPRLRLERSQARLVEVARSLAIHQLAERLVTKAVHPDDPGFVA